MVPVTIEVEVPFELHRYIIGQKGNGIRKMMEEFEVSQWFSTSSQVERRRDQSLAVPSPIPAMTLRSHPG